MTMSHPFEGTLSKGKAYLVTRKCEICSSMAVLVIVHFTIAAISVGLRYQFLLFAAFLVSFALDLVVAEPPARRLEAVGNVVVYLGKSGHRSGLQLDGERQYLPDPEY